MILMIMTNDEDGDMEKDGDFRDDEEEADDDSEEEDDDDNEEKDDDDNEGKLLHPLIDMEDEKDNMVLANESSQLHGAINDSFVASYDAKSTQEQANVHVVEQNQRVGAANEH